MHLWPERVVPKCAIDRSLAIAHGMEDTFWIEGASGRWNTRTTPAKPIDELVRERSSPAVKAALKSLLEAPATSASIRGLVRRVAPRSATQVEVRCGARAEARRHLAGRASQPAAVKAIKAY
jgi:hypothetical protein